jgi:mannose-6-phosphate isomerase-like protein (cupin superfamily)
VKSKTCKLNEGFRIAFDCRGVQAAEMTIAPGDAEGGPDNRHAGADQWLYVVSGSGVALVEDRRVRLGGGTLLLIERGERHEIRNTGRGLLRTMNFYSPAAYTQRGTRRRAARP